MRQTLTDDFWGVTQKYELRISFKVKRLRHNNSTFVTKGLRKAIMKRSRLKNLFNKQRTHENWVNYKMQENQSVNL